MIVIGTAASEPLSRKDSQGRTYFSFKLREDVDSGEFIAQSFFTVHAYIDLHLADLVSQGHLSRVMGRLEVVPYITQEGGVKAKRFIITRDVTPSELERASEHEGVGLHDLTL